MSSTDSTFPMNPDQPARFRNGAIIGLIIAVATMLVHGWSLGDGLFLDDHWHQRVMRESGWSWSSLLHASTIKPDQFMHTWWQETPIQWQYARPFSILFMKVAYHLTGGNVPAQHAVSIALHFINACMVYVLCMWLTRHRFWSLIGTLLFVVYSHSVFAVAWLAAQNMVLQTTLMLGALLCYFRASGLRLGPIETVAETPMGLSKKEISYSQFYITGSDVPPLRVNLFAYSTILWLLALFSRENAVIFPVIILCFDLAFGGRRHCWARRYVYLFLGVLTIAFILWRLVYFFEPMPDVYVRRPDGTNTYYLWCLAKLMHYLCSAVWLSPMTIGPTGRINPFAEVPGDCILTGAILLIMSAGYYFACRKARGYWIWPLWLLLSFLPVIPMMATPHCGYNASIAFSVAMILGPGLYKSIHPGFIGRWCKPIALWFMIATCIYIPIYRTLWEGMLSAEKQTTKFIAADEPPNEATHAFFINLPFVNIYQGVTLEERWGPAARNLQCYVLTYAPALLRVEDRCYVEQIDAYRLRVSIDGAPYFSGLLGRYLLQAMRDEPKLVIGEEVRSELFDSRVDEITPGGVHSLEFRFKKPLASSNYRFYLTTKDVPAMRLVFREVHHPSQNPSLACDQANPDDLKRLTGRLAAGEASAGTCLLEYAADAEYPEHVQAWLTFRELASPLLRAMGSRFQQIAEKDQPTQLEIVSLRHWWQSAVENEEIALFRQHPSDNDALNAQREGLFTVRRIASQIIRSDLYLTGPPFPGPQ